MNKSEQRSPTNHQVKRVAILQSSYIPWKGYFDIINLADEFFFLDHVQYSRRDWRNRNLILTSNGPTWLTIPIKTKGRYYQKIFETEIADRNWAKRHWTTICHAYAKAPYFKSFNYIFEEFFLNSEEMLLSRINCSMIKTICGILGIETKISFASGGVHPTDKSQRLVEICDRSGAGEYLSGPAAKNYLNLDTFAAAGMRVLWMNYSVYPEYLQQHSSSFQHGVSILDPLFNLGVEGTREVMLSFKEYGFRAGCRSNERELSWENP